MERMRWKALLSGKEREEHGRIATYGFKSRNCPTQHPDLLHVIKSISFKPVQSNFEDKLHTDIHPIRESNKAFISADKTRHLYRLDKNAYD